jgi:predicted dienelactone hydrolase
MWLTRESCASHLCLALAITTGAAAGSAPQLPAGSYAIGKQDIRLVDSSRGTEAYNGNPPQAERVLETSVWYPAQDRPFEWLRPGPGPLDQNACPAPLVIYSHGFMSFRNNGAYIARYLASQGYIVAAADFPLTHFGTPGGPQFTDVVNQPGDVSFIIDSLLDGNDTPTNRFADCLDPTRIGAVGLSLGGMTTTLLVFHPRYRDPRIQTAVSIAGPVALFGADFFATASVPFSMIAGDIDAMVDYRENAMQLRKWLPDATLVTLQGGSHTGFAGMAARLFNWLDNPDSIGCWAMRGRLDDSLQRVHADLISRLQGKNSTTAATVDLLPCRSPELPRALRPKYQQTMTKHAVFALLQRQLHPAPNTRHEYSRLLEGSLSQEYPELEVVTGP